MHRFAYIINSQQMCQLVIKRRRIVYLYTNPLPAVLALHRMFDDRIIRDPFIETSNGVQGQSHSHKVQAFVDEHSF
jgi:hypothetical protein